MESLAYSGGFDSFGLQREQFFAPNSKGETFIETILRYGQLFQQEKAEMQNSLFGDDNAVEIARPVAPQTALWPSIEKLNKERELVGIYLSAHPLDEYEVVLHHMCNTRCGEIGRDSDVEELRKREELTFGGIVTNVTERFAQKTNKPFGIITIEDFDSSGELMLYADEWLRWKGQVKENYTVYITAKYVERFRGTGRYDLRLQNIEQLYDVKQKRLEKLTLRLNSGDMDETMASEITAVLDAHPGDTALFVQMYDVETQSTLLLRSNGRGVDVDRRLLLALDGMENLDSNIN